MTLWDEVERIKKQESMSSPAFSSSIEDYLCLWRFHAGFTFYDEDDTFTDIGAMVSHALQLVSYPEHLCRTLQDTSINLKSR
ncbi:MAG: hypothetical protein ACXVAV_17745, partial [Ktedonobacteraceae bacterium]